jgi:hypothetical protein
LLLYKNNSFAAKFIPTKNITFTTIKHGYNKNNPHYRKKNGSPTKHIDLVETLTGDRRRPRSKNVYTIVTKIDLL